MASSVGERNAQVKRPLRIGLIFLPAAAIVLTAMLVAGCGGSEPHVNVQAGLQHYFSTFHPEDSVFPSGAGPPRVKDNGCKDLHRKGPLLVQPGPIMLGKGEQKDEQTVAVWKCFVRFDNFTLMVQVAVKEDSNEVVFAVPVYGDPREAPKLNPARTYTG